MPIPPHMSNVQAQQSAQLLPGNLMIRNVLRAHSTVWGLAHRRTEHDTLGISGYVQYSITSLMANCGSEYMYTLATAIVYTPKYEKDLTAYFLMVSRHTC